MSLHSSCCIPIQNSSKVIMSSRFLSHFAITLCKKMSEYFAVKLNMMLTCMQKEICHKLSGAVRSYLGLHFRRLIRASQLFEDILEFANWYCTRFIFIKEVPQIFQLLLGVRLGHFLSWLN